MSLFRIDLAELSYEVIEEFCGEKLPESVILDYKGDLESADPEKQVIKAVSALANTQGGLLLFGIRTVKDGTREYPVSPPEGMAAEPAFEQKVRSWCMTRIEPPLVPRVRYIPHPDDDSRGFGVIQVDESIFTPHTVSGGTRVYVRRADNSVPVEATLEERELLRNRRAKQLLLEENHREDIYYRIGLDPELPAQPSIFLTVIPRLSRDDAIAREDLTAAVAPLVNQGWLGGATSPRRYSHGLLWRSEPRPVSSSGGGALSTSRFAISARGAFGFAKTVRPPMPPMPPDTWMPQLDEWQVLSFAQLAVVASVRIAEISGFWGQYQAEVRAYGWDGTSINRDNGYPIICADDRIHVSAKWQTEDARASWQDVATVLAARLAWAFNLTYSSETVIRDRLSGSMMIDLWTAWTT